MTDQDGLTRLVILLAQQVKRQQVEIREFRGRLHTYETTILSPVSTKDSQVFRTEEAAQIAAAQGAAQDEISGLISELRALLPPQSP